RVALVGAKQVDPSGQAGQRRALVNHVVGDHDMVLPGRVDLAGRGQGRQLHLAGACARSEASRKEEQPARRRQRFPKPPGSVFAVHAYFPLLSWFLVTGGTSVGGGSTLPGTSGRTGSGPGSGARITGGPFGWSTTPCGGSGGVMTGSIPLEPCMESTSCI